MSKLLIGGDPDMHKYIERLTKKYYGEKPVSVASLGGGFYGRVFLAGLRQKPYKAVIKIYLFDGLNQKEAEQLGILSRHSSIKIPQVYFVHDSNHEIPADALIMEYIDGINAGSVTEIPPSDRERIADQIVDNLIGYHKVVNPQGFGQIYGMEYEKDWRVYYRKKAESICQKAADMRKKEEIGDYVSGIAGKAYANYDRIFSQPVETACLIHGDYNTWNVLLNREATGAVAVIDPFNCCWADPELDLYQLGNANGGYFNLLEKYKAKVRLSSNFKIKICFYELFTEIMHFYDAQVDASNSNLVNQAKQLEIQMQEYGF